MAIFTQANPRFERYFPAGRVRSMGLRVEAFFGAPQDIEWSFRNDELLLLQSRPVTTL